MTPHKRQPGAPLALLVALVLLAAGAQAAHWLPDLNEPATDDTQAGHLSGPDEPPKAGGWLRRLGSRLPAYFDLSAFKRSHARVYSRAEEAVRKAVFMERCLRVFKSRVAFRLGRAPYLQSINHLADLTELEMKSMFMAAPPLELRPPGAEPAAYLAEARSLAESRQRQARGQLFESESQLSLAEDEQLSAEEAAAGQLEAYLAELGASGHWAGRAELSGAPVETMSQAAAGGAPGGAQVCNEQDEFDFRCLDEADSAEERDSLTAPLQLAYAAPKLRPGELVDWSRHGCFHTIYDQGRSCGKCYVMAATTLAEFYKCAQGLQSAPGQAPKPRKFSKDYVLDCGPKYASSMMGCAGGSVLDSLRFIRDAGIFNVPGWRAKISEARAGGHLLAEEAKCPLNEFEVPFGEWGPIKLASVEPEVVAANGWRRALRLGPLVAAVQMPPNGRDTYAAGVHDGRDCATSGDWHAMVLVGYGTSERGEPYWLFRNSWGADWGERGHFKLDMRVEAACLAGGVRLRPAQPAPGA